MTFIFVTFALMAILGGCLTILGRNAVHAALGLVACLISVAGLYVTLNAHFLAAVQVIVYAGAIMVLFLFVIMLLNAAKPVTEENPVPFVTEVAGVAACLVIFAMVIIMNSFKAPAIPEAAAKLQSGAPGPIGEVLFTKFLLPFEAVSILLLVAVVGSVALVKRPEQQQDNLPDGELVGSFEGERQEVKA
ncbi:NADH-quinone oxidoreductase subunit J family protein [Deinococcus roseus]|uniref:NADH-quinone oxidoreductase subunit J n=1 Tax=Deinococcus roseus TaxID=392414 RepID=A0ABQ2CV90_9DEIO|nr:NADH-quinone oxidoreductase subunit J [Deinococcus roseus]GGJ20462.1 NADH dehydrogenase subunit J [Deinococcus roseus]